MFRDEGGKIETYKVGFTFNHNMAKNFAERFGDDNHSVDDARPVQCTQEGWDEMRCQFGITAEDRGWVARARARVTTNIF